MKLRQRLFWWGDKFTDWACDLPDTRWSWLNELPFAVEEKAQAMFCALLGHHAIPDHCGIPDHDGCAWCRIAMPGAASRSS